MLEFGVGWLEFGEGVDMGTPLLLPPVSGSSGG